MIVRNPRTGALHEVPDQQLYEVGTPVYDGFGNPVGGLFDDIVKGVKSVVSGPIGQAASSFLGPVGGIAGKVLGNIMGPGGPPAAVAAPIMAASLAPPIPMPPGFPVPMIAAPLPAGWVRPPLPYTGLVPRRLYMRCAVWPGPKGLVPQQALTMQPQPPLLPGALPPPGGPTFVPGHRARRHHRR